MPRLHRTLASRVLILLFCLVHVPLLSSHRHCVAQEGSVANTAALTMQGDIASTLVDGVDQFLMDKLAQSPTLRDQAWANASKTVEEHVSDLHERRKRLAKMLGVVDQRCKGEAFQSQLVHESDWLKVFNVSWPVLPDPDPLRDQPILFGEGILLVPKVESPIAYAIALPDSANTPEQIAGISRGVPANCQFARSLAELGCVVLVPTLVNRDMVQRNSRSTLSNREYLYRPAFELGRHLIGYEIQSVLAAIDLIELDSLAAFMDHWAVDPKPILTVGYGDGGMLALYTAALDERISGAMVSGYLAPRESIWQQPLDRNVFGLLNEFGDAELARMIAPRKLFIECTSGPTLTLAGQGGAPAKIEKLTPQTVRPELERCRKPFALDGAYENWLHVSRDDTTDQFPEAYCAKENLIGLLSATGAKTTDQTQLPLSYKSENTDASKVRMQRRIDQIDLYTQLTLRECVYARDEFMKPLYDAASSGNLDTYKAKADEYRKLFADDVIGSFDDELLPAKPRTRLLYDEPTWQGHEVVLDVFPDVIAYGILILPKDLKPGERRPVVVCQHGLEGRPQDIIAGDKAAYHDFAAKLAEQGFITFAPQNLYIFEDRFRVLQRKANPLGKTLFSVIVPQHQQIVNWLKELPMVDPDRIAFYGLSYGGKSAMRIPALVPDYCLSICSADFNEWVDKNASTRSPHSYVWSKEYEIFEFGLGERFNYAEMAALIAPRPFMVERGHHDNVASDETVAHEFARVHYHYEARLKLPVCEIEWFDGPHTINGQGTYRFLHEHLRWPAR